MIHSFSDLLVEMLYLIEKANIGTSVLVGATNLFKKSGVDRYELYDLSNHNESPTWFIDNLRLWLDKNEKELLPLIGTNTVIELNESSTADLLGFNTLLAARSFSIINVSATGLEIHYDKYNGKTMFSLATREGTKNAELIDEDHFFLVLKALYASNGIRLSDEGALEAVIIE